MIAGGSAMTAEDAPKEAFLIDLRAFPLATILQLFQFTCQFELESF